MTGSDGLQFQCQECKKVLTITGGLKGEGLPPALAQHHRPVPVLGASLFTGGRGEESFVVLDKGSGTKRQTGDDRAQLRNLDESFVVLPGSASVQRQAQAPQAASQQGSSPGWSSLIQQLTRAFEIATTETKLDHPLCSRCMARVKEETTREVKDVEADIATYEQALKRLQTESMTAPSLQELAAAEKELDLPGQQAQLEAAQAELAAAEAELAALDKAAEQLGTQESQYWHEFNNFQACLATHVDDRDGMLTKVDRLQAQQARLRRTNVLNEVFHINCDGVFGVISGFRMGRTSAQPVEWDEINAAWGQAVLLLHTLAQMCQVSFQEWQLLPMGSYPRITDGRTPLQLYGPVQSIMCPSYNRAMSAFLSCTKRFAAAASARDREAGCSTAFDLPFAIDGDKVGDLTIRLTLGRDSRWTKALKYLLVDLKWCLAWANEHATPSTAASVRR